LDHLINTPLQRASPGWDARQKDRKPFSTVSIFSVSHSGVEDVARYIANPEWRSSVSHRPVTSDNIEL
jgi:hypothetical protein